MKNQRGLMKLARGLAEYHHNQIILYCSSWRRIWLMLLVLFLGLFLAVSVLGVSARTNQVPGIQSNPSTFSGSLPASPPSAQSAASFIDQDQPANPLQPQDWVEHISITDSGFAPAILNVIIGTEVVWTNNTAEAVTLQSGEPHRTYLPMVVKSETLQEAEANFDSASTSLNGDFFSVVIQPGETYSKTFMAAGTHPYFLASKPSQVGTVIVEDTVQICGDITQDTTWAYATYVVNCWVTVNSGVTLTVTHGAVVKINEYAMYIHGKLVGEGTPEKPVVFTSYKDDTYGGDTNGDGSASFPAEGNWYFLFVSSSGQADLDHTILSYGGRYYTWPYYTNLGNLYNEGGVVSLDHITSTLGSKGVRMSNGTLEVKNSLLASNSSRGVEAIGGNLKVMESNFQQNGETGLYAYNISAPVITNTTFLSNTGYAMYLEMSGNPMDTNQVSGNSGSNNGRNGIVLNANLTGNSVLAESSPNLPYVLPGMGSLTVNSGAHLDIGAGAIFKMDSDASIVMNGTLSVTGTSTDPVWITSLKDDSVGGDTNNDGNLSSPSAENWYSLLVSASGHVDLEYVNLRYGGRYYTFPYYTNLGNLFNDGGVVSLDHITSSVGVFGIRTKNGSLEVINSQLVNNSLRGLEATGGILKVVESTIQQNGEHGLYAYNVSAPVVTGTTFLSNTGYAMYLELTGLSLDTSQATENSSTNNGRNGTVIQGDLSGSSILAKTPPEMPYVLRWLTVNSGAHLDIAAGAEIKMDSKDSSDGQLTVNGTLSVTGTSAEPVIFTSIKDDSVGGDTNNDGTTSIPVAGDWYFVRVVPAGQADLEHAILHYGGKYYMFPYYFQVGNFFNDQAIASLDHITSTFGVQGIRIKGGSTSIQHSMFTNNENGVVMEGSLSKTSVLSSTFTANVTGLNFSATISPTTIAGNSFDGNTTWGLNNTAGFTILAENNWWGSANGPTHWTNQNGDGDAVSDNVDFDPWLTVLPLLMIG